MSVTMVKDGFKGLRSVMEFGPSVVPAKRIIRQDSGTKGARKLMAYL